MAGSLRLFTYTLTNGSITIAASDNVQKLSLICRQGTISFEGNSTFQSLTSNSIEFAAGFGTTIVSGTIATPIDGVTITALTGADIADIEIAFQ